MDSKENGNPLFSESCEVLSNGCFIQYKNEPMYLKLSMVTFKFSFEDTEEKKPRLVREYKEKENTVIWTFQNYNNDIGIGTAEPIATGTIGNKTIYFSCRVFTLGGSKENRMIVYSVYAEK